MDRAIGENYNYIERYTTRTSINTVYIMEMENLTETRVLYVVGT